MSNQYFLYSGRDASTRAIYILCNSKDICVLTTIPRLKSNIRYIDNEGFVHKEDFLKHGPISSLIATFTSLEDITTNYPELFL